MHLWREQTQILLTPIHIISRRDKVGSPKTKLVFPKSF